ncbi:hypothetical protein AA313_de0206624 [Arthrobotrys entomopaga]|nr:hypothetical protein AA313_de0206624 [Arthrobotrys entomopaga]
MSSNSRIAQQEKRYYERYAESLDIAKERNSGDETDRRTDLHKRLIVCCDGTWFAADKGADNLPSNVARIGRLVATEGLGVTQKSKIVKVPQIVYYQSGVGTGNLTWFDKRYQAAFGHSLDENVCTAYNFLCNNYAPGDELFFFGFSRGAYTARALAGLVATAGILPPGEMHLFYEMYKAYKNKKDTEWDQTEWFKNYMAKNDLEEHNLQTDITIKFVGVWDTVGALGVPDSYVSRWTHWNDKYAFHDTEFNDKIEKAAHALALDEYRGTFGPTLWFKKSSESYGWGSNLIQCWFPGYHAHVGGGTVSGKDDETSIDDIALAWMVDQVGDALTWDEIELDKWVREQIPGKKMVNQGGKMVEVDKPAWGEGNLQDSASYAYLSPGAGGWDTRKPGQYDYKSRETKTSGNANDNIDKPINEEFNSNGFIQVLPHNINKAGRKWYPTHEYIHPVVRYRMKKMENRKPKNLGYSKGYIYNTDKDSYDPAALKNFKVLKENNGDNFVYWKKEDKKNGDVIIREYQVPPSDGWFANIGLERRIIPPEVLAELDSDNNYQSTRVCIQQVGFQPSTWYNQEKKSSSADPFIPETSTAFD